MPRDKATEGEPLVSVVNTNNADDPTLPGYIPKSDPRRRCVQCDCVMRPVLDKDSQNIPTEGTNPDGTTYRGMRFVWTIKRIIGYGYEGNGEFCTLRCGYQFAREQRRLIRAENTK